LKFNAIKRRRKVSTTFYLDDAKNNGIVSKGVVYYESENLKTD